MAVTGGKVERQHFAASEQVVGRVFETEERTTDTRNTAVKRNLLAPAFADLQRQIYRRFFIVGATIDVFILVDRIEVTELIQFDD